jgi:hypothetical protein
MFNTKKQPTGLLAIDPSLLPDGAAPAHSWKDRLAVIGATLQDVGNAGKVGPSALAGIQKSAASQTQQKALSALAGSLFNPKLQMQVDYQGMPSDPLLSTQSSSTGMVTPARSEAQTRDFLSYINNPTEWAKSNAQNDEAYTLSEGQVRGVRGQTVQSAPKFQTVGGQFGASDPATGYFAAQGAVTPTYQDITNAQNGEQTAARDRQVRLDAEAKNGLAAIIAAETHRHNVAAEATASFSAHKAPAGGDGLPAGFQIKSPGGQ